jgi:hypothetical protein
MKFSLFKSARSFSRQSVRNSREPSEACERIERCCDGPSTRSLPPQTRPGPSSPRRIDAA